MSWAVTLPSRVWPICREAAWKAPVAAVSRIFSGREVFTVTPRLVNRDAATVEKRPSDVTSTYIGRLTLIQKPNR